MTRSIAEFSSNLCDYTSYMMYCLDLFVDHQWSRMHWKDVETGIDHKFDNNIHISSPIAQ